MTTQPKFQPYAFPAGQYTQKTDSFMVLLDASGTMNESYKGQTKFHTAREVVSRMNQTIPADLRLSAALRAFGQAFSNDTALRYGLTSYEKAGLEGALKNVSWGGWSPLSRSITAASDDLESTKGNIAVFVVSDGMQTDGGAVSAAKDMKNRYGDRVCIYTILIGNNPTGKDLMEQVALARDCGFSANSEDILSSEDMGSFVAKTFLGTAADSDGDGVADYMDKCPNTPKGAAVDAKGCPLDSDGDGVADDMDKCPDTPKGATVDAKGCPLDSDGDGVPDYLDKCPNTPQGATVNSMGCWAFEGKVLFETNSYLIRSEAYPLLNDVAYILKNNSDIEVEIQGHTDSTGTAKYNQWLSEKRAQDVMQHLVKRGIDPKRLRAKGYGLTQPVASNDTLEGRSQNRRVELKPIP
jgi:OOP family OmpA-OmpF porin